MSLSHTYESTSAFRILGFSELWTRVGDLQLIRGSWVCLWGGDVIRSSTPHVDSVYLGVHSLFYPWYLQRCHHLCSPLAGSKRGGNGWLWDTTEGTLPGSGACSLLPLSWSWQFREAGSHKEPISIFWQVLSLCTHRPGVKSWWKAADIQHLFFMSNEVTYNVL